jgi:AraC family transcriptional activator of pobA
MKDNLIEIKSISELDLLYGCTKPKHPLIRMIDLTSAQRSPLFKENTLYKLGFYAIFFKKYNSEIDYGRLYCDFHEGSIMFTFPNQVIAPNPSLIPEEGWGLFFHPDILIKSDLNKRISDYSFFHYDSKEALHISEEEKSTIWDCIEKIKKEYSQNIDKHTQNLIQNNIELLLNYCERFYDRQFFTRVKVNIEIVKKFEQLLNEYFSNDTLLDIGLPDVKYFANELNFSPNYLSDLLKKHTGKTTQELIHLKIIEDAKKMLWNSEKTISEIAYILGFEHPSHFTKIFKNKTGLSPNEYRSLN